jgi:hypothetical protein
MLEENSQIEPCRNPITEILDIGGWNLFGYWDLEFVI